MTSSAQVQKRVEALAREVHEALGRGRPDRARVPLARLVAALPQHPNVVYLQRWAGFLELSWPATRGPAVLAPRSAPDAIDLVIFHVDLPAAPSGQHAATDYMQLATLSFEAMALVAPGARRILLTDERTEVPADLGADKVIRVPIDPAFPMFERMRAQADFLDARATGRATVFMDADVVTNCDPADIFVEDFDVGLTWRAEQPEAPFNGGLLFVGPGAAGTAFFRRALDCYEMLASHARLAQLFDRNLKAWWGDQFALALLVGYRDFARRTGDAAMVDDARVRFFPAAEYNFTPDPDRTDITEVLATRRFIHFKGNRKAMQERYLAFLRAAPPRPAPSSAPHMMPS